MKQKAVANKRVSRVEWTPLEVEFDRLVWMSESRDQVTRIDGRFQLQRFIDPARQSRVRSDVGADQVTNRDPIFATLDALIAEGPPDWPDEAEDKANRDHIRSLIRDAGVSISPEAVFDRINRGWALHDAIHKPLKSNGKLGTKRGNP